jgi:hypothetical protein
MMQSTFEISINGKKVFTWEGDQEAAEHILEAFPRAAEHVGMTARQFANNCVHALIKDPVGQEMQMMAVIWCILESETGNPDHPGTYSAYVGAADFTVDLHETKVEGGFKVEFNVVVSPHGALRKPS